MVAELRLAYRRHLLVLAARDLAGEIGVDEVGATLADLADRTLSAGLAVALAGLRPGAAEARLAVIGMGKCGGRELNYVSDVDVVFVADGDLEVATRLASDDGPGLRAGRPGRWTRRCGRRASSARWSGPWPATRRTTRRWARTWEFQALLKARPAAGDLALGAAYVETLAPLVWTAAEREHFVADVQAMRRRVEDTPAAGRRGPGDQARAGRAARRRVRRPAAAAGARPRRTRRCGSAARSRRSRRCPPAGTSGGPTRATLTSSYHLLRSVEHRLQLQRLRRTHLVPGRRRDGAGRRWLARAMGFRPDARGDAVAVFDAEWALHAREVRRLHEKLFYRPLLHAVARVPGDQLRLSPEQAARRLEALGFADPDGALRHLSALTAGVSRRRGDPADAAAGGAERARRRAGPGRRACWRTGRCPTRSATRPGTCGSCGTRAR